MARGIRPVSLFDEEEDIRDPYAIAKGLTIAGGATLPRLFMEKSRDIKLVNEYMKQNLASRGSPLLSQSQWAKTYGSKLPNKLFEQASGQKGSILKWLTGRTSPTHFGPVEKGIKFAKSIMPTIMNMGSKMAKFPNPVMTVLQGLAPKTLASGMLPESEVPYTPFEQPTTNIAQPTQTQVQQSQAMDTQLRQSQVPSYTPRQTTQSVAPAPKRRARATRGRTAPVMRAGPPNMQRGFRGPHR
jgi:hypothetical protein